MNHKIANFISNLSYTLGANIITFLVSMIIILAVPKVLGVGEYGYFQLYLFYTSYVIFFHFGLPNGIYLRYGGKEYTGLNKSVLTIQFWMMTLYALLLAVIGSIIIAFTIGAEKKGFILIMTCLCGVVIIPRDFILLMFQATNRIKDYVKATIIDRIAFIIIVVIFLIMGVREYSLLIAADIFGKLLALGWIVYLCKDMVFQKLTNIKDGINEALKNISAGSKILISNIANMMIIGIMRMGIEYKWDIETFGKVSLTLSLSNLMMVVINAISIVIYPMLRRAPREELPKYYCILRNILMVPLLGIIIIYYPMKEILALWLPSYADSLTYIALLFPICIYECKMSMLVNTYLKNLRKEKCILFVNLVSVVISAIISFTTIFLLKNLVLTIVSIVLVIAFRCIFAEILLSKSIRIKVKKDILLELLMCIIFMSSGWLIQSYLSTLIYAGCYVVYVIIKRIDIKEAIQEIKSFTNIPLSGEKKAKPLKLVVVGTGYVGLVTGVCLADIGHDVTCVDIDETKIDMIKEGKAPIYERDLEELMVKNYKLGRLKATTDYNNAYKEADVIFVGVGTPELSDGSANLSYIETVLKQIAKAVIKDCLVVIKSTVPVGTNDKIEHLIKTFGVKDVNIKIASNPEFLSQGTAIRDTFEAARIIIGTESKEAEELLRKIYEPFGRPIVSVSGRSAEMIKYASNCFLAIKISYMNDIANLCELVGANIEEVAKGMSYDKRIGENFINVGIGYGGSSLPQDTKALVSIAKEKGYPLKTVNAAIKVNEEQRTKLFIMACKHFSSYRKVKVAVLGLSFKPGTDDLREAPSLENVALLVKYGADIYAYDPVAENNFKKIFPTQVTYTKTPEEALMDATVCFIFTEWREIKEVTPDTYKKLMRNPLIYDGRNIYKPEDMKNAGVVYYSIGR